jgi:hypothetical protein
VSAVTLFPEGTVPRGQIVIEGSSGKGAWEFFALFLKLLVRLKGFQNKMLHKKKYSKTKAYLLAPKTACVLTCLSPQH